MKKENVEILDTIFLNVNEWLKFAESKNAIMITIIGASIFALAELFEKASSLYPTISQIYFTNIIGFLLLAFLTLLCSFLPQVNLFWIWQEEKLKTPPNVLFYGDLARITPEELIDIIYEIDDSGSAKELTFKMNFAEQIINNSKIANRKYNYFRIAVWLSLSGILTPVIGGILYLLVDPNSWYSKQ